MSRPPISVEIGQCGLGRSVPTHASVGVCRAGREARFAAGRQHVFALTERTRTHSLPTTSSVVCPVEVHVVPVPPSVIRENLIRARLVVVRLVGRADRESLRSAVYAIGIRGNLA